MTTKFISMQSISIRPQNDTERLMLENLFAMITSGKEPCVKFEGTDMILEIKSKK